MSFLGRTLLRFRSIRQSFLLAFCIFIAGSIWYSFQTVQFLPKVVSWELVTTYSSNVSIIASGAFAIFFAFLGSHITNEFSRTLVSTSKYSIPVQMVSVFIGANVTVLLAMVCQVFLLAQGTFVVTGVFGFLSAAITICQANVFWILGFYFGYFLPKWIAYPLSIALPFGFEAFATAQEPQAYLFQNLGQTIAPMMSDPLGQVFNWRPQVFSLIFWMASAVMLIALYYLNFLERKVTLGLTNVVLLASLAVSTLGISSEPVLARDTAELVCKFSGPSVCIWPETNKALPSVSNQLLVTSRKLNLFDFPVPARITTEMSTSDFKINSPYSSSQSNVAKSIAVGAIALQGCDVVFVPASRVVSTLQAQFALSILLGADVSSTAPTIAFGGEASAPGPTKVLKGLEAAKFLGVVDQDSARELLNRWQVQIREGCPK